MFSDEEYDSDETRPNSPLVIEEPIRSTRKRCLPAHLVEESVVQRSKKAFKGIIHVMDLV